MIQREEILDAQRGSVRPGLKKRTHSEISIDSEIVAISEKAPPKLVAPDPYLQAAGALHVSNVPSILPCRSLERGQVLSFLEECVDAHKSGSLYVAGPPGVGKSATVAEAERRLAAGGRRAQVLKINAMQVDNPRGIFQHILGKLWAAEARAGALPSVAEAPRVLEEALCFKKTTHTPTHCPLVILIIDEIDRLVTKDADVLYRLFELPFRPRARVVLVGIANRIDLAAKFLPHLAARNCSPLVVTFRAYDRTEIAEILTHRLSACSPLPSGQPVVQPQAVELLSRTIAASSGDIRKALDLARTAVESVGNRWRMMSPRPTSAGALPLGGGSTPISPLAAFASPVGVEDAGRGTPPPPSAKFASIWARMGAGSPIVQLPEQSVPAGPNGKAAHGTAGGAGSTGFSGDKGNGGDAAMITSNHAAGSVGDRFCYSPPLVLPPGDSLATGEAPPPPLIRGGSLISAGPLECPSVTIADMAGLVGAVLDPSVIELVKKLPQHQRLAMGAALQCCGEGVQKGAKPVQKKTTAEVFFKCYSDVCLSTEPRVEPVSWVEFCSMIVNDLVSRGLLTESLKGARYAKGAKVKELTLNIRDDDVRYALLEADKNFFSFVLESPNEPNKHRHY